MGFRHVKGLEEDEVKQEETPLPSATPENRTKQEDQSIKVVPTKKTKKKKKPAAKAKKPTKKTPTTASKTKKKSPPTTEKAEK